MMNRICLFGSLWLLMLGATSAQAACQFRPYEFFPDRNDRVHILVQTDVTSFCDNSFREGPGYHFTDVSVVRAPPQGVIATVGPNHFAYHALPNAKGFDHYTIRACAIVGERHGCSTLIYDVAIH